MKKNILLLSILVALSSCGTMKSLSHISDEEYVSTDKNLVYCNLDNKPIVMQVSSLWRDNSTDAPYPVMCKDVIGSYESWMTFIKDKPEYQNVLSEKAYTEWLKTTASLLKKHSKNFKSFLFTIPGRVIAYTEKQIDINALSRSINCAVFSDELTYNRYRRPDFGYKPSLMAENPERFTLRTLIKDRSNNMLIAIDRIYLQDSDKILCLMYTCAGKYDYILTNGNLFYNEASDWYRFKPLKNIPMAFEFFYKQCDPISISAFKGARHNRITIMR